MSTKKITQLPSLAQIDVAGADVVAIVDVGAGATKKVTGKALVGQTSQDLEQTWNAGATVFTAHKINVTDTASDATSKLQDLQVGGVSKWGVKKDGELTAGIIPFARLQNNSLASFYSTSDQTGSTTVPAAVTFNNTSSWASGISIASSSQITFANAGIYLCSTSLQFDNSSGSDRDVRIWYRINGSDVANTTSLIAIPQVTDGGKTVFELTFIEQVTAGQYIEIVWLPVNVAVTLDYTAAAAGPPAVPAIPSALFYAHRIA